MNVLRNAKNPQSILQILIQKNPQLRNIMNYIKQHGGDPEKAFYEMAKEKGVDPNEVLKMLQ